MPIRLDLYRLRRAARQRLSRDQRTPEERRLDELRPVASIQSLTDIGRRVVGWTCASCCCTNDAQFAFCTCCGRDRRTSTTVRS